VSALSSTKRHAIIVQSLLPVMMVSSSAFGPHSTTMFVTSRWCPFSARMRAPVLVSHARTTQSCDAAIRMSSTTSSRLMRSSRVLSAAT